MQPPCPCCLLHQPPSRLHRNRAGVPARSSSTLRIHPAHGQGRRSPAKGSASNSRIGYSRFSIATCFSLLSSRSAAARISARWLSSSRGSTLSIPRNSVIQLLPLGKVYPTSRCGQLWLRQMSTVTGRSADLTFSDYHCRQAPRDGRSLHVRKWVKMRWISCSFGLISARTGRRQMVYQLHRCAVLRLKHHK